MGTKLTREGASIALESFESNTGEGGRENAGIGSVRSSRKSLVGRVTRHLSLMSNRDISPTFRQPENAFLGVSSGPIRVHSTKGTCTRVMEKDCSS